MIKQVCRAGLAVAAGIWLLAGCSQSVNQLSLPEPELQLQQFFRGSGLATGVMHNWRGRQALHFTAELCGQWQGQRGDLYEIFRFSDGRTDKRHWRLQLLANGQVRGQADDVVGDAVGAVQGNTMLWQYQLLIPQADGDIAVTVSDELYLVTPTELLNRAKLTKFGLGVGELMLSIRQLDANADCTAFIGRYQQTQRSPVND